jgi:hypothetical protein
MPNQPPNPALSNAAAAFLAGSGQGAVSNYTPPNAAAAQTYALFSGGFAGDTLPAAAGSSGSAATEAGGSQGVLKSLVGAVGVSIVAKKLAGPVERLLGGAWSHVKDIFGGGAGGAGASASGATDTASVISRSESLLKDVGQALGDA